VKQFFFTFFVCVLAVFGAELAKANEAGDGVIGWVSPSGPSGSFASSYEACEAQWNKYMNNGFSRYIGARPREDDWTTADCEWTRYQYLCPQETGGGFLCSTLIPSVVRFECEANYTQVAGGYCRKEPSLERSCASSGRANPTVGNPIVLCSGAKLVGAVDYESPDGQFAISRSYRSFQVGMPLDGKVLPRSTIRGLIGGWNFDFAYEIQLGNFSGSPTSPGAKVAVLAPDGTGFTFVLQPNGDWIPDPALGAANAVHDFTVEHVGSLPQDLTTVKSSSSDWRLVDSSNTEWLLSTRSEPNSSVFDTAWPTQMTRSNGYEWQFAYASDSALTSITDSFGRVATISWSDFHITSLASPPGGSLPYPEAIATIDLPDGTSLAYSYDPPPAPSAPSASIVERLVKVERLDQSSQILDSVEYLYEDQRFGTHLTGIIDNLGQRSSSYAYDSQGRATLSEGLAGADSYTVAYSVAGNNRIRRVTNPLGKVEEYTFAKFTGAGANDYRLTQIDGEISPDTAASTETLSYGVDTFVGSTADAENRAFVSTRDAKGRPTTIVEASGSTSERTISITWHASLNVPVTIVRDGLTEARVYDAAGLLQSTTLTDTTSHTLPYSTNGQSRTNTYHWDANGRLLSTNGPLPVGPQSEDDITSYTYDTQGNLLTVTNALGHVTTYSNFGLDGRPGSITDANGAIAEVEYDSIGRAIKTTAKHPTDPAKDSVTLIAYDAIGRVLSLALPATDPLLFEYDAAGRLGRMYAASGESWNYSYDAMGNVVREDVERIDGSTFRMVRKRFDELGRLINARAGIRSAANWDHDKVGNVVSATSANGHETTAGFDALDRIISTVAPDSGTTSQTYDERDNALTFTDPISVTAQFVYNGFGEVIQETSPDRGTNTYLYNAAGRMIQSTDGRGQVIDYVRDYLGRVTNKTPQARPASEAITYQWDSGGITGSFGLGKLAKVIDGSGTTFFKYDHRGDLIVKQQAIGSSAAAELAYEYDTADRITQITYPSGRLVRYGYDSKGRVNLVETKASSAAPTWHIVASNHSYEPFGPVASMDLGNGLAVANEWGSDSRLASRRLYLASNGTDLSNLSYRRDSEGGIGAVTDHLNSANSILSGYDSVGRLTLTSADSTATASETYSYTVGTNRLASFTDASGTRTISYDGRGNTVSEARPGSIAVTAAYDGHGRLTSYDRTNTGLQSYSYNGLDDRVKVVKPTGTRHFVYDAGGRVLAEYGASASDVKAEFIWALPSLAANDNSPFGGGEVVGGYTPLAVAAPDGLGAIELLWVHGNHLGVPLVYSNDNGTAVAMPTDYLLSGFPGQSRVMSDLYYNRYRDYDSATGRYIQADPIGLGGDVNPYAYAGADPVNMVDPLGLLKGNPAEWQPAKAPARLPVKAPPPRLPVGGFAAAGFGFAFLGIVLNDYVAPALQRGNSLASL